MKSCFSFENLSFIRYQPYSFNVNYADTSNIVIKAKNANLTRKRDGGYTVTITDSSNCAELNCYSTQKNKVVLLESKQIRPIEPHFYVGINLLPSGSYLDFNVFKTAKLRVTLKDHPVNVNLKVVSFEMSTVYKDSIVNIKNDSANFNQNQLDIIQDMPNNHPIIINKIKVKKMDGSYKMLDPIVYYVKH